ncbi:MAG: GTPase ObgE [Patescibacteria group bacterium]
MLIDDIKIKVKAGHGGRGAVAFNKNMMSLGPVGGTGGKGASIYAEGVSDLSSLNQFRFKKDFEAENGQEGRDQFRDGHDGEDLVFKVPVGTVVHRIRNNSPQSSSGAGEISNAAGNLSNGDVFEITKVGERLLIAKGGNGGKGNFHFRSSTNTSPKQFQLGLPGEEFEIRMELKLIADIGFIGLPNAGKSSLLNELTNAKSKVANYPFTTLEPNLGTYFELILADIPGLIEGSSAGKGLGIKFLRHIERTKIIFHLISAESEAPAEDYKIIRKELGDYSKDLIKKPEYLFLSKSDVVSKEEVKKKLSILKKISPKTMTISIYDDESLEAVKKILNVIKRGKIAKK